MQSDQHQYEWVIEPVGRDGKPLTSIVGFDLGFVRQIDDADQAEQLPPLPIIEW